MPALRSSRQPARQRGMALVVALVLLLVMTMVAVVATRTTTVDLKMTTNTVLARRAFQSSEGTRTSIGPTLEAHIFYRGWPSAIGGSVPATARFPVPTELTVEDTGSNYFEGTNGNLADFADADGRQQLSEIIRDPDLSFKLDLDADDEPDNADMFGIIWVTRTASMLAAGAGAAQGSGYLGPGVGAAGAGAHVYFDLKSRGQAPGNAASFTGADYRVLVRN
jgi:hypothetical protein